VKRRTFIAGLGSAAVWPLVAGAQQATQKPLRRHRLLATSVEFYHVLSS
jgi:hypothetical protein